MNPTPNPTDNPDQRIASYRDSQLQVLFAITLMSVMGVATIGPALPLLRGEFELSVGKIALVITAFTLPGVFLTPLMGLLADRVGRKVVLVPSLVLFGLAGGACSLARSIELLLALRVLQGVGAASLGSLNVTLIGDLFRGRQRTTAMGLIASVLSVGTATYPLIGGALAAVAWNWPFALPLVALPVALIVAVGLHEPEVEKTEGLRHYLSGVWREICRPAVLALFTASCGIFILLYGAYVTFLPLLMAERFHSSPVIIGAVMTSTSVVTALASSQLGRLAGYWPETTLVRFGFGAFAAGLVVIPFMPTVVSLVLPTAFLGIAFATTIPVVMTLLAALAPDDRRGVFMSLNGTVLRLGQTVGPVVMTALYDVGGFRIVYFAGAVVAVAMAFLMAVCLPRARSVV